MSCGYGSVPAVSGVDVVVRAGEIVALLGPNGAGKTTTLLALAGVLPLTKGQVRWQGRPAEGRLHHRARQGLSFVGEDRAVFFGLSVQDNLRLGASDGIERAIAIFPELAPHVRRKAGLLSGGQQKMLALAIAIAADPVVLLVDELSLGLAPRTVEVLLAAVADVASRGTGVLLVEQRVHRALELADRAYVMARGQVVMEGDAATVRDRLGDLEDSYLGTVGAVPDDRGARSDG